MLPAIFENPQLMNALRQTMMRQPGAPSPMTAPTMLSMPNVPPEITLDMVTGPMRQKQQGMLRAANDVMPEYDDGSSRPGAMGAMMLAALVLNAIDKGSGDKFAQGFIGGRQNLAANNNRKAGLEAEKKQKGLTLEAGILEEEIRRAEMADQLKRATDAKASERDWEVELLKLKSELEGKLLNTKNENALEQGMQKLFSRLSPQARAEIAPLLGITPEAAAALTPEEKGKQATAALTDTKRRDIEKQSDVKLANLIKEGKIKEARAVLIQAQTGFQNARVRSENRKTFASGSTRATMGAMAATDAAHRGANDAISALGGKPITQTSFFNAMSKLEDATTKADASLQKLNRDLTSFESELALIRAGKAKGLKPGTEESEARELEKAISDTRALMDYYTTIRDRSVTRMRELGQRFGLAPANGMAEPIKAQGMAGALLGAGPSGPIGK